jgi:hypothetical protein
MLLLTDGTVMVSDNASGWSRLTPSSNGSYVNGTWSAMESMSTPRLYFASHILRSGDVWVLGGEYSGVSLTQNWTNSGEKYSLRSNSWSAIASHPDAQFGDVPTMLLDGDKILAGANATARDSNNNTISKTYLYDIATDSWTTGPNKVYPDKSIEENWVKLSDGSVLTYDIYKSISAHTGYAETYTPDVTGNTVGAWSSLTPSAGSNGSLSQLSNVSEEGAVLRLCDGRIFIVGAGIGSPLVSHTALYNPATNTWAAGPDIPNNYLMDDAPAAVLPNCHVLLAAGAGRGVGPTGLFDFNPIQNTISQITTPTNVTNALNIVTYLNRMLVLPTGQVLLANSSKQLWVYTPDPIPALQLLSLLPLKPVINKITYGSGVFHLTGKQITGQSAGSVYGDDAESDENYPIIRLQNRTKVYYARTSNWSTTGVGTGDIPVTTDFCFPQQPPRGSYSLILSAAGLQSLPVAIYINSTMTACP